MAQKQRQDPNASLDRGMLREMALTGQRLMVIDQAMQEWSNTGMIITSITVQGPELRQGGYLAIIKGMDEARKPFVAFRSGETYKEVNEKIGADLAAGTLAMKEDKPWVPPAGNAA